ncbi:MAG TPA: ATPase domain-containing protein [Burkholderiaceae bacterium]|nr:ATPase domain-containing protein [Burkholderiaceae bacterium]
MNTARFGQRSPTGVPGLDDILDGGFIAERLYLIDGRPGAGKTTLALQYLLSGAAQSERCLYITLSESAEELRANARSHGWSLDAIEIFELMAEDVAQGDGGLVMYHPSEVELSETTRKVLDVVRRTQPQRLVFDSLSELRLLAQNSLRYRRQILALKQHFAGAACTVLLLDDRTAEGEDLQLQSIAHGVITLDHRSPDYGAALRQLQVLKFRGSAFRSGLHDLEIVRGGMRVFPRLVAAEHGRSFARESVPSGVDRLDTLLGGGIDRGTATLLLGAAGTGKSTVALQYAAAAALRGEHAAIFSFEEAAAILLDRAQQLGIPVQEGVGPGQIIIRRLDPGEVLPGQFAHLVRAAVEEDHATVIIIDSLNGYLTAMPEERALHVQLHELMSYLNNFGVATFIVAAQNGLLESLQAPIDASYLADTVVHLRLFEHKGEVKKAISVLKKRSGRHEQTIRQLWFDEKGVHLSEPLLGLRGVLSGIPTELDPPARPGAPTQRAADAG